MPQSLGNSSEDYYNLPFDPTNHSIYWQSIALNAEHHTEIEEQKRLMVEYNLHNLWGAMQMNATHHFLTKEPKYINNNKRPFILSRSTFAGSGKWGSHWLGDNWSRWEYMRYSISGIMSMNVRRSKHNSFARYLEFHLLAQTCAVSSRSLLRSFAGGGCS